MNPRPLFFGTTVAWKGPRVDEPTRRGEARTRDLLWRDEGRAGAPSPEAWPGDRPCYCPWSWIRITGLEGKNTDRRGSQLPSQYWALRCSSFLKGWGGKRVFIWKPKQYRLVSVLKRNTESEPHYIFKRNGDLIFQASRRGLRGSLDPAAPSHSGSLTRYSPTRILYSPSTWFPSDVITIPDLCTGSSAAFPQSQGPSPPISA